MVSVLRLCHRNGPRYGFPLQPFTSLNRSGTPQQERGERSHHPPVSLGPRMKQAGRQQQEQPGVHDYQRPQTTGRFRHFIPRRAKIETGPASGLAAPCASSAATMACQAKRCPGEQDFRHPTAAPGAPAAPGRDHPGETEPPWGRQVSRKGTFGQLLRTLVGDSRSAGRSRIDGVGHPICCEDTTSIVPAR